MKKVAIIGAGPTGLYVASLLNEAQVNYSIYEASDHVGGQIINLYPNKKFMDVDGYLNKESHTFIDDLTKKINNVRIKLNEKVIDLKENNEEVIVVSSKGEGRFSHVIITTGLGSYTPRKLGVKDEDKCLNILYSLKDFSFLKNKRVAIFGGGDSALDWAKEISAISDDVHLIHRRLEFRGNANTIKNSHNLKVHLPYVPFDLKVHNQQCISIKIKKVNQEEYVDIPVDYVLVNYGSVPVITPFKYPHEGNFLKVDQEYRLSKRVFAIGDAATYLNKIRRIEPMKKEAISVVACLSRID